MDMDMDTPPNQQPRRVVNALRDVVANDVVGEKSNVPARSHAIIVRTGLFLVTLNQMENGSRYLQQLQRMAAERGGQDSRANLHPISPPSTENRTNLGRINQLPLQSSEGQCIEPREAGVAHPRVHENSAEQEKSEEDISISNPLALDTSTYVTDPDGRPRYLGQSSTWSFSRRTLALIRNHINHPDSPEIPLHEDMCAYSLNWDRQRPSEASTATTATDLPSLDFAVYLTNTVKFHIGQMFHLFDESEYMQHLYEFYEQPSEKMQTARVWYIQFLVIIAFGKAFVVQGNSLSPPPGSELFVQAMSLLPSMPSLYQQPLIAVEVLCAISLYLQSADMRTVAYIYIGDALRIALSHGLHREMPMETISGQSADRCRNIWWTVYILNQKFTSSMGVPTSIQDHDVTTNLLPPANRARKTTAISLGIHVKLSRLIAQVVNNVYSGDGRLDSTFLTSTQKVLRSAAALAYELEEAFPLSFNGTIGGISRVSANLHLSYNQCIIVATRPLLLSLFQNHLENPTHKHKHQGTPSRKLSEPIQALFKTAADSANRMLRTLSVLHNQGLLESFLPFDLDHAFSAAFFLSMVSVILPTGTDDSYHKNIDTVHILLDNMISRGSVPASFRKAELQQFDQLVNLWQRQGLQEGSSSSAHGLESNDNNNDNDNNLSQDTGSMLCIDDFDLPAAQFLSVAQLLEFGGNDNNNNNNTGGDGDGDESFFLNDQFLWEVSNT